MKGCVGVRETNDGRKEHIGSLRCVRVSLKVKGDFESKVK